MKRISKVEVLVTAACAVLLGAGLAAPSSERHLAAAGPSRRASSAQLAARLGDVPFTVPLGLRTVGRSSVREGPGSGYPVLFTVEAGTSLTGHAYLSGHAHIEDWVRVSDEGGRSGWVLRALVMPERVAEP